MPVTTFGGKYPLDDLIRPYLSRFSNCMMASYFYAQKMTEEPGMPLFIDSGGFASIFEGSEFIEEDRFTCIKTKDGDLITPPELLAFQEKYADIGATLDFIIPPKCDPKEGRYLQELTLKNATWACENKTSNNFMLFASIQAWNKESAMWMMERLVDFPFDGFALGGMVPRIQTPEVIVNIVRAVREVDHTRPLHVFGIGKPKVIIHLFNEGVDSTDSSSPLRLTADKRYLKPSSLEWEALQDLKVSKSHCNCNICQLYYPDYFLLNGEINNLALALHNLNAYKNFI